MYFPMSEFNRPSKLYLVANYYSGFKIGAVHFFSARLRDSETRFIASIHVSRRDMSLLYTT